ncbi:MAG: hypothetical protein ABL898_18225, partial [Hyphomicrobiaceae bacterium]
MLFDVLRTSACSLVGCRMRDGRGDASASVAHFCGLLAWPSGRARAAKPLIDALVLGTRAKQISAVIPCAVRDEVL